MVKKPIDVYLASLRSEVDLANQIEELLVEKGLVVFRRDETTRNSIPKSKNYFGTFEAGIKSSYLLGGAITDGSNGSRWFEHEVTYAMSIGLKVLLWKPPGERIGVFSHLDSKVLSSKAQVLELPVSEYVDMIVHSLSECPAWH